jgi:hypothetical protein
MFRMGTSSTSLDVQRGQLSSPPSSDQFECCLCSRPIQKDVYCAYDARFCSRKCRDEILDAPDEHRAQVLAARVQRMGSIEWAVEPPRRKFRSHE